MVIGKGVFTSTLWGLGVLSPPSYTQLLGTAVSVDADLALEPPVPLSVWHQEVCAAVCPFLQYPLGKEGVTVARKAVLVHVAVLRPAGKCKIKLSPHMMLIPIDSITGVQPLPTVLASETDHSCLSGPKPSSSTRYHAACTAVRWCCLTSAPSEGCFTLHGPPGPWLGVEGSVSRAAAVHKAVFQ